MKFVHNINMFEHDVMNKKVHRLKKKPSHNDFKHFMQRHIMPNADHTLLNMHHIIMNAHAIIMNAHHIIEEVHHKTIKAHYIIISALNEFNFAMIRQSRCSILFNATRSSRSFKGHGPDF